MSNLERETITFDWISNNVDYVRSVVKSDEVYFAADGEKILETHPDSGVLHDKYTSPVVITSLSDLLSVAKIVNREGGE